MFKKRKLDHCKFDFKEYMQSKSNYFNGWMKKYSIEENYYESFEYFKNNYSVCFTIDCQGWKMQLHVKKDDQEKITIWFGECDMLGEFDKNNIRERVRKVYNAKLELDKKTGLYIFDTNEKLIDLYIDFLIENGILTSS